MHTPAIKSASDKTNFAQSLMHMIKGNLGTGLLAMPITFAHCGLYTAVIALPLLCLVATYCVHLLVRSSQHLQAKLQADQLLDYAELAKGAFKTGPGWVRPFSGLMCRAVDAVLIISQVGICCVYLVFVVNNLSAILWTYDIKVAKIYLFIAILPVTLLLSYIKTLRRLSIASGCANALQVVGIVIVLEYLIREMPAEPQVQHSAPFSKMALGFGSAMFAFEGISVVLPIYSRMKRPEQVGGWLGIINLSYFFLLLLYFAIGYFGYLKFGHDCLDSITMNLPRGLKYDIVRAIFTGAIFLTYPLQFYVPNQIVWNWLKSNHLSDEKLTPKQLAKYDYLCRTGLVLFTFVIAISVPLLNFVMDLVGSISGTALSVILPALIHLVAFWQDTSGCSRAVMLVLDCGLMLVGLLASLSGSYFSLLAIIDILAASY